MNFLTALLATTASAASIGNLHHPPSYPQQSGSSWDLQKFTSLVIFGDSYSDDSRLGYFINSGGDPPPVGWVNPPVSHPCQ